MDIVSLNNERSSFVDEARSVVWAVIHLARAAYQSIVRPARLKSIPVRVSISTRRWRGTEV